MLMNYHEMTMTESSDSPQKKRQFALICAVMVAAISYAVMTSGVLVPIEPTQGIFPGGNYCYKLAHRDYAASMGLGRRVISDLVGEKAPTAQKKSIEQSIYHVYLDDPHKMGGRRQRWASGIMVADSEKDLIDKLMSLNNPGDGDKKGLKKRYPTAQELLDWSAQEILAILPYELGDLPSVDSLVLQFPHTHGFVSALVLSYKVCGIRIKKIFCLV